MKNFDAAQQLLTTSRSRFAEIMAEELLDFGVAAREILMRHTPRATGALAVSTRSVVNVLPGDVELTVLQGALNLRGRFYQDFVVRGRPPGRRPPVEALLDWVKIRWQPTDQKQHQSLAFKLARHIGRRGTVPQDYVTPALTEMQPLINDIVRRLGVNLSVTLWDFDAVRPAPEITLT